MQISASSRPATRASLIQRFHRMDEVRFGMLLMAPAVVVLLVFLGIPIAYALIMSFQQIELTISPDRPFVGLDNYASVLTNRAVHNSITRTLFFAGLTITVSTSMALTLALVLNEQFRGRKAVRVFVLLPWAVAPVVSGVLWRFMFQSNYGLVNALLFQLGVIPRYMTWLNDATLALAIASIATSWKTIPFLTLIILAALQTIPETLYRAIRMDGGGRWARFRYITLPHLRGILIFIMVTQMIVSLQVFDLIFTLTRGGPGQETVVLSFLVYLSAFERLSLGNASAMAILLALLIIVLGTISLLVMMPRSRGK